MENAKVATARRRALADTFRAGLIAQLISPPTPARSALIDAAVSCHVEIQEISSLFLRAKASAAQQRQLGVARQQLARLLISLGASKEVEPTVDPKTSDGLEDWIAAQTGGKPVPKGDSEGSSK